MFGKIKFQISDFFKQLLKVAIYSAIALIPFQNCSKGGNSSLSSFGPNQASSALKAAPIPVDISLNQFSFMSCPLAGETTESFDPHMWPFYTLKYGAYDNTNTIYPNNFLYYNTSTHVGGIGIGKDAVDQIQKTSSASAASFLTYIRGSPYTNNHMISSALILKDRSPDLLSEYAEGFNHLEPLHSSNMLNYLSSAQLTASGTRKQSFFPNISTATSRALVGAINFGKSEADLDKFVSGLNNHYLAIGFVPAGNATDAKSIIQNFVSPDSSVSKRIGAKGYSFNFQYGTKVMTGVTEWDLNPKDYPGSGTVVPINLNIQNSESWMCFNARIVRDIDRKAWQTTTNPGAVSGVDLGINGFVHPQEFMNPAYGPLKEYYFANQTDANNVLAAINAAYSIRRPNGGVGGIYYACPSEDPATMTAQQKDVLKIMRRFLPAEYFDINVSRSCVVPLDKAKSTGSKCYASGDSNNALYVQYFNKYNYVPGVDSAEFAGVDCGPNRNECPSYVSFCWRLQ